MSRQPEESLSLQEELTAWKGKKKGGGGLKKTGSAEAMILQEMLLDLCIYFLKDCWYENLRKLKLSFEM